MIRLNCFFQAKEEKYTEALEAAVRLTVASREQQGCVAYDVMESATRPDVFMICETWADQAALDAHSASEVFATEVGNIQQCGLLKIESFTF